MHRNRTNSGKYKRSVHFQIQRKETGEALDRMVEQDHTDPSEFLRRLIDQEDKRRQVQEQQVAS